MSEPSGQAPPPPPSPDPPVAIPLPTTFGGVAALARARGVWLSAWQILTAALSALVVVWTLQRTWGRDLERAIPALPESGAIRAGRLIWPETNPRVLHQGIYLGIRIDPAANREGGLPSDVTLSLEDQHVAFRSFLGWAVLPYPLHLDLPLSRLDMAGAHAAWKTPVLIALGGIVALALPLAWLLLATVYAPILWIGGLLTGRRLGLRWAWRIGAASLLPAAAVMTAAIALYGTRQLGLPGLLIAVPAHLVVGWIYCAGAFVRSGNLPDPPPAENPFQPAPPPEDPPENPPNPPVHPPPRQTVRSNPFRVSE